MVLGATGYIGGRLVPQLLEFEHQVRILVRDRKHAGTRSWSDQIEIVQGDLLDAASLTDVFDDIEVVYYLVHSMYAGKDFARHDRIAADNFCAAASGVAQVIYLGGPLPSKHTRNRPRGSEHLRSRAEIGRILAAHLPTTEFRAGPIIGSGSGSFEMLRYLTERLPVMIAPRWINSQMQPIAVRDVIAYLCLALSRPAVGVVEIGANPLTFRQMILEYARLRHLHRFIFRVPFRLPAWLIISGIGMITPIPDRLVRPLVQSMEFPLRGRSFRAKRYFPEIVPISYTRAVQLALANMEERAVITRWSDTPPGGAAYEYTDEEGMMREVWTRHVTASCEEIFDVLSGLGGEHGWLRGNWVWALRGVIDRLLGGPGVGRGRRDPDELHNGEALAFWRVEAVQRPNLLRLRGELKLPGHAWMQWELRPDHGGTLLTQSASFSPHGFFGTIFWYALYPIHSMTCVRLIDSIEDLASTGGWKRLEAREAFRNEFGPRQPPRPSHSMLSDLRTFMFRRSPWPTEIDFSSESTRIEMSHSIMQRVGLDVSGYSVLNLHCIGIDAPAKHVFEELVDWWNRDSACWPNHLATVGRVDGDLSQLRLDLFGKSRLVSKGRKHLGWPPLFRLHLLRSGDTPSEFNTDSGRYLLYECKGGYPVGYIIYYVRSSIEDRGEKEATQIFFGVSFDFYGKESWPLFHPVNRIWEFVHNRVSSNVLCRFKQLCEWRFERIQEGMVKTWVGTRTQLENDFQHEQDRTQATGVEPDADNDQGTP